MWNTLTLAVLFGAVGATLPPLVRKAMISSVDRDLRENARRFLNRPPPGSGLPRPPRRGPDGSPNDPLGRGPMEPGDRPAAPEEGGQDDVPPARGPFQGELQGDAASTTPPLRPHFIPKDSDGTSERERPWDTAAVQAALNSREAYSVTTINGEPVRVYSWAVPQDGPPIGVLQVPYSLTDVNRAAADLTAVLMMLAPLALVAAGAGGYLLTGRALRPVEEISAAAEQIGGDALSQRLPAEGEDEFGQLSSTFNRMLARLDDAFQGKQELIGRLSRLVEEQRRFTADASHELRSPLTAIKANASLALSGPLEPEDLLQSMREIDSSATVMSRLVDDLLLLAKSDSGQLARNPVLLPIREPITQAVARARRAERAAISVCVDEELTVLGCQDELMRLFSNLLENAARHTPGDGTIEVAAFQEADRVIVEVRDSGCGMAAHHLPHLGERFYRVDSARARIDGGSGLGLSICREIALAHGGGLEFESEVGRGTTARVRLPLCLAAEREPELAPKM
jgi:signal transduction histidine kinase